MVETQMLSLYMGYFNGVKKYVPGKDSTVLIVSSKNKYGS